MKALFSKYSASYDPGSSHQTMHSSPLEFRKMGEDASTGTSDKQSWKTPKSAGSKNNSGQQIRHFVGRRGSSSSPGKTYTSDSTREDKVSPFNTAIAMSRERGGRNLMDSIRRKSPSASADKTRSVKETGPNSGANQEAPLVVVSARESRIDSTQEMSSKIREAIDETEASRNEKERSLGDPVNLSIPERRQSRRSSSRATTNGGTGTQASPVDENATPKQTTKATFTSIADKPQPNLPASPRFSEGFESAPSTPQIPTTANEQKQQNGDNRTLSRIWKLKSGSKTTTDLQQIRLEDSSHDALDIRSNPSVSPSALLAPRPTPAVSTRSYILASELNDLAVAHEKGLLGEEEYRLLRQATFLKTQASGGMELPREERFQSSSRQSITPTSPDSSGVASSPPPSMTSRRSSKSNIMSLFRRGSKVGHDSSSVDAPVGGSVYARSMQSNSSQSATLEARLSQARQARSIRSDASHNGAMYPPAQSKENWAGMNAQPGRGSSFVSGSGNSASGMSMSSGSALLADQYRDKTGHEIEAEIALVESEGKRIAEGFESLQMSTMGRYNLSYDLLQKAVRGLDDVNEDEYEEFVLVDSNANGTKSERNGSIDRFGTFIRKNKSTGNVMSSNRLERSSPPSSYKGIAARGATPAGPPLSLLSQNHVNTIGARDWQEDSNEGEDEVLKLRAELTDIIRRRNGVAKRYADRLAFLRSTLRSAEIRQTLR